MENRHHFLVGNHDAKSAAKAHPNYVGDYGYVPEQGIFFLSGAFTVSAPVLQNSAFWYKDEELSVEDLDTAFALYCATKPRILLSHEGPAAIVEEMLNGVDGNYHEAKRACVTSRTAIALQRMIDTHADRAARQNYFPLSERARSFRGDAVNKKLESLSPHAKKSLAAWLRKRFANSVPPNLLWRISDESLLEQYFRNGEEKRQSLADLNPRSDDTRTLD